MGLTNSKTNTSLVQLDDETLIEVSVPESRAISISSKYADKVKSSLSSIRPLMINVSKQITSSLNEIPTSARPTQAEIEFGISFDEEGSVYLTKLKTDSNFAIKLIWVKQVSK